MYFPDWKDKVIHESSPINRGASIRLAKECAHYIPSQLFGDRLPGTEKNGVRCEDLEHLTFADASIDLHVTQDVMEHVFNPGAVFREIARTLKPGGAHVFTVPIVNKHKPSRARAVIGEDGEVTHLLPPVYHGNPVSADGALVTVDWGFDICRHIFEASGLFTHVVHIDDLSHGIRAEYIEVLVTLKPGNGNASLATASSMEVGGARK
ncbi:MAG: class I SAM-dependent methyltransferase [Gallionellaceae bacterium]|nr:class I SAM-dependent methyltransferase [Gallionellaceae bacterium]